MQFALCSLPQDPRQFSRGEKNLLVKVSRRIARDADVLDVFDADTGGIEAITNRLCWKPGAVFLAIESFLFDCRDQVAVANYRRRRVAVICVESKNVYSVSKAAEVFSTPEGWNVYRIEAVIEPHPARGAMCDTELGIQSRIVAGLASCRDVIAPLTGAFPNSQL